MKLLIDFKSDWHDRLRAVMVNEWRMNTADLVEDLPIHFFNALQRRISPRPRLVLLSDTFACPAGYNENWNDISRLIRKGCDLSPYLSSLIDRPNRVDSMLNEWGVYHLHFRARPARSGPLIFARITDAAFFAIGVFNHEDWCADEVIETLHRNWPEEISAWTVIGLKGRAITPDERKNLRSRNINSFYLTSDGTTYGSIGGGMMTSGHNSASVRRMDMQHDVLEQLEEILKESAEEIRPLLMTHGYSGSGEVSAKLLMSHTHYQAYYPAHRLIVSFASIGPERDFLIWPDLPEQDFRPLIGTNEGR